MPNTREKLIELIEETYYCSIEELADHLIANGVTVQKWIPVTERLPEKNTSVLVYYKHGRNIFWYDGKDGFCDIDNYGMTCPDNTVTHWMPLPEPPKGE